MRGNFLAKDKRLANPAWRLRVGFDNIMSPGDLRERKRQERDRQRRQSLGLSE